MIKDYITGLQHIGIPTKDFKGTLDFYESLGFKNIMQTKLGDGDVAFLQFNNLVIETYTGDAVGSTGAIAHIALDVTDVDDVFKEAGAKGYKMLDKEVNFLKFWDGVRFFTIEGVNGERVEFNQKL
ncbi:MAG: VOC family protein [Synergistaceae bacterium]|jgi:catechol 2,3-dioxygenase-like lactoylglutathione lyase family enzyme|nr:VOC family protein [Synergistaceae bacterium]